MGNLPRPSLIWGMGRTGGRGGISSRRRQDLNARPALKIWGKFLEAHKADESDGAGGGAKNCGGERTSVSRREKSNPHPRQAISDEKESQIHLRKKTALSLKTDRRGTGGARK